MLEQGVLDLGGCDVLAAPDDGVVGAALAEQVALDVEPAPVAGVQPAVVVGLGVGTDVLAADLVAADLDLAGLVGAHGVARVADDADLDARHRLPDRRQAVLEQGLVAVEREPVVVGTEDRDGAARLGEPVGVDEVDLGEEVQRPFQDRGPACGSRRRTSARRLGTRSDSSASIASTILPSMVGTSMAWVTCSSRAVINQSSAEKRTPGTGTMRRPT